MKILFLSHTFYGGVYRVGSHELVEIGKARGHNVLHVSTPLTPFHHIRRYFFRNIDSQRFQKNDFLEWNLIPFILIPIQFGLSRFTLGKKFRKVLEKEYDLILIDQVFFLRFLFLINPSARILLRLTDVVSDPKQIKLIKKNINQIDKIVVTSKNICTNLGFLEQLTNIKVIPNGVSSKISDAEYKIEDRNGFIYIGALDDRIDWTFIESLSSLTSFSFLHLYGSGKIPKELPQGVTYLGTLDFVESLQVMGKYKYLVLPYKENHVNLGRSPMKLANSLKMGLIPVVPEWMRLHEPYFNEIFTTMTDLRLGNISSTSLAKKNSLKHFPTWEESFQMIIEFSLENLKAS